MGGVVIAAVIMPRGRQFGEERGVGEGKVDAGGVVVSSASWKGEDEGGGISLVVVIIEPHWRQRWGEKGAGEQRR